MIGNVSFFTESNPRAAARTETLQKTEGMEGEPTGGIYSGFSPSFEQTNLARFILLTVTLISDDAS